MNTPQLVVLAAVAAFLMLLWAFSPIYLKKTLSLAVRMLGELITAAGCILTGCVAALILNLLLNINRIHEFKDVLFYLDHLPDDRFWDAAVIITGIVFTILAWVGYFQVSEKLNLFQRGRRLTTREKAQGLVRGPQPPKHRASLFKRLQFRWFLMTRARPNEEPNDLTPMQQAATAAKRRMCRDDLSLFWGMVELPLAEATGNFMVVGCTGSGKSITLRFLMQSVLPNIGLGLGMRALIFDAKRDILPVLRDFLPEKEHKIHILNPFDDRSVMWDMAQDVDSLSAADAIARIFIPAEPNSPNPFFPEAAQQLLGGVLRTFITACPKKWTLRDVVLAMRTKKRLQTILGLLPENAHLVEQFLNPKEERTSLNILSTIATKIKPFEIVAAVWEKSDAKISLNAWLKEECILLLAQHPARKASLDPINQAFFHRLSEILLSSPETEPGKTWIFLDELREAGRLEGLVSLINQGRSKGLSVVIGFQSIEGLYDVYGQNVAEEITGQCANKTFLRTDSQFTARWAENHFGQHEEIEQNYSYSTSTGSIHRSESVSYHRVVKHTLLASELMTIPKTGKRHGLSGMHDIPLVGSYRTDLPWAEVEKLFKKMKTDGIPEEAEIDRPAAHQYIKDWQDEDFKRLRLKLGGEGGTNLLLDDKDIGV
jgi:hypothetical protein